MAKQRCSKHPMIWEPCSVCAEIKQLKENRSFAEESSKRWQNKAFELQEQLQFSQKNATDLQQEVIDTTSELNEALETVDHVLKDNVKPERMNPYIRNRLFVQDLNNVRGFLLSYTFLHNTIIQGEERIKTLAPVEQRQWTAFITELKEVYERWIDLKNLLINDMSNSNWERMKREIDTIVKKIVTQVNHRNLGHWTLSEEGTVDIEYQVRPLVEKAIGTCINSAGTNNLTAYSKEMLVKDLIKIVEEK